MAKHRLLLVDDDPVITTTLYKGLSSAGYEVSIAYSGQEAIDGIDPSNPPVLALVDFHMPDMSGPETAKRLNGFGIHSLFISADTDLQHVRRAIDEGALGYLIKPLPVAAIIPEIKAAIHRARDLARLREEGRQREYELNTLSAVNVVLGVLMQRHHLDRQAAMNMLYQQACRERTGIEEFAEDLLMAWTSLAELRSSPEMRSNTRVIE